MPYRPQRQDVGPLVRARRCTPAADHCRESQFADHHPAQRCPKRRTVPMLIACMLLASGSSLRAQSIEPRSYSNAPVGVNFIIGGLAFSRGGVAFDTSLPVSEPELVTSTMAVGYARTVDLWGRSGRFDIVVPYTRLSGSATYQGDRVERDVTGFGDALLRVAVNLYGAPPLTLSEFRSYKQDLIIGGSLQVSLPTGQYDDTKLVNLGSHRWFVKPEVGASKAVGPWIFELKGAVTLFTDNDDFFNGHQRSQAPLYSVQANAIYNLRGGMWYSIDVTYFAGGRTTLDGQRGNDLQQNWRFGATLAVPMDVHSSLKLYASTGVSARTGNNFDLAGVAWQYRWGGGL